MERLNERMDIRATQHLLIQGFAIHYAPAAVCTRIVARGLLDNTEAPWAVVFYRGALTWTAGMAADDPLAAEFAEAAVRAETEPMVLCQVAGGRLLLPLTVADVKDARMRIEAAVALELAPPAERLEAFPDELIQREAERRSKLRREQGAGERGTDAVEG